MSKNNPFQGKKWLLSKKLEILDQIPADLEKNWNSSQCWRVHFWVLQMALIDDTFVKDSQEWYHHYGVVNVANTERRIEGLEFVFVELPKFRPKTLPEKKLQVLWLRFLTEVGENTKEIPADLLGDKDVTEAIEYLRESAFTEEEMTAYDKYWDGISVERTLLHDALTEGEAKGEARGRAEGRAEGERLGKQKTAIVMLRKGIRPSDVADFSGLPLEAIPPLAALLEKYGPAAEERLAAL